MSRRGRDRLLWLRDSDIRLTRENPKHDSWWRRRDSHSRHPACNTGVLLLNYVPNANQIRLVSFGIAVNMGKHLRRMDAPMERLTKKQEITHIALLYGSIIFCWIYAWWGGYETPDSWAQAVGSVVPAWSADFIIGEIPTMIGMLVGIVIGGVLCFGSDKLIFDPMIRIQRDLDFERDHRPVLHALDELAGVNRMKDW